MKKKRFKKIRRIMERLNYKGFMYGFPFMFALFYGLIELLKFMSKEYPYLHLANGILALMMIPALFALYILSIVWIYLFSTNLLKKFGLG